MNRKKCNFTVILDTIPPLTSSNPTFFSNVRQSTEYQLQLHLSGKSTECQLQLHLSGKSTEYQLQLQLSGRVQNNSRNYSCQEEYSISAAIIAVRQSAEYQLQLQLSGRVYNVSCNYSCQTEYRIQSTHLAGKVQIIRCQYNFSGRVQNLSCHSNSQHCNSQTEYRISAASTIFQAECGISTVTTRARQSTKYQLPLKFFMRSAYYQLSLQQSGRAQNISSRFSSRQSAECLLLFQLSGKVH
jgi:hypothetical protein